MVDTYDRVTGRPNVWIHLDSYAPYLGDPRRTVLMIFEPEVIAPFWYDRARSGEIDAARVFTYDRRLISLHPRFRYLHCPLALPSPSPGLARETPLVMINARKHAVRRVNELYSERERVALWFARRHAIALYGSGWGDAHSSLRRPGQASRDRALRRVWHGVTPSKEDILYRADAMICFENMQCPGYRTEKLFDALACGVVPVYLGDPEITDVVDGRAFINYAELGSPAALNELLSSLTEREKADIRRCGSAVLESDAFVPHRADSFAREVVQSVIELNGSS